MSFVVLVAAWVVLVAAVCVQAACTIDPTSNPTSPVLVITETGIQQTYLNSAQMQIRFDSTQQFNSIVFNFLDPTANTYGVPECDHSWLRPPSSATNTNNNYTDTVNGANCNVMFVAQYPSTTISSILSKCFALDSTSDATHNTYTANVRVTTRQDRPPIRTLPITRVTVTNIRFSFKFQKTITVSTNQVSATGNVTTSSAVVEQIFNTFAVLGSNNAVIYPASSTVIRILTSVQYPYKLTVGNVNSAVVGAGYSVTSILEISSAPNANIQANCPDVSATICYQLFEVVVTQPASVCTIGTTVTFNFLVICENSFTGTCLSAQSNTYSTTYSMTTNYICVDVVENINLSGNLITYAVFSDANAGTNPINQFIFGQTIYAAATLTASAGSPNIASSSVDSVVVTSAGGSSITFSSSAISNGYLTYSFASNRPAFQFDVNSNTVALSSVDSAQTVTITATISVLYQNLQSETRVITMKATPNFGLEAASSFGLAAEAVITNGASQSSSTATSSTSLLAIVAGVVGGCVLVAIVVAVVIYRRTTSNFVRELQGQSVKVMQVYVPSTEMTMSPNNAPAPVAPVAANGVAEVAPSPAPAPMVNGESAAI